MEINVRKPSQLRRVRDDHGVRTPKGWILKALAILLMIKCLHITVTFTSVSKFLRNIPLISNSEAILFIA